MVPDDDNIIIIHYDIDIARGLRSFTLMSWCALCVQAIEGYASTIQ